MTTRKPRSGVRRHPAPSYVLAEHLIAVFAFLGHGAVKVLVDPHEVPAFMTTDTAISI